MVCDRSLIATCTPMPPALPTIGVHLELIHVRFDNKDVQKLRCGYDWSFDSCSHCCRPWAGSRVMARVNQCGSSGPQKAPFPTVALVKRAGEVRYETYRVRVGHSKTGSPAAKVLRHRSDARSHGGQSHYHRHHKRIATTALELLCCDSRDAASYPVIYLGSPSLCSRA